MIYSENKREYLLKHFEEDFRAKEFVQKILEEELKAFYYKSSDEFSMVKNYFNCRKYSYKILNDDFDCDAYIKQIAPRVFALLEQNSINRGFKIFKSQEEFDLLKDIEDCEVICVNEKKHFIEIVYLKEHHEKYLTIKQSAFMSSMAGIGTYFQLDNQKLDEVKKSSFFQDISQITKIFHLAKIEPYFRDDIIDIIYKNKENMTCSYRLNFGEEQEDDLTINIQHYENIFSFKTDVLNDTEQTQLDYSYDNEYFEPKYYTNKVDEHNQTKRVCFGNYYLDYPLCSFGGKIRFEFDEKIGIKAFNISSFDFFLLPHIDVYHCLSKDEKAKLHHFLATAELYINDLFVNRDFDNELFFDTEKNPNLFEKLDTIKEKLEKNHWNKTLLFSNAEQGHPATQEIFLYSKEDEKFLWFLQNDWISEWVTIKYNDELKSDLENILKE